MLFIVLQKVFFNVTLLCVFQVAGMLVFNILTRGHHTYDGHTIDETEDSEW